MSINSTAPASADYSDAWIEGAIFPALKCIHLQQIPEDLLSRKIMENDKWTYKMTMNRVRFINVSVSFQILWYQDNAQKLRFPY